MAALSSPALRLLVKKIDDHVREHSASLAIGGVVVPDDLMATGAAYLAATQYTRALNDVRTWCSDVEDELLGRATSKGVPAS